MSTDHNISQLLQMLDNPEAYSEQQILDIVNHDEATREAYRLMVAARQGYAYAESCEPSDAEKAWARFAAANHALLSDKEATAATPRRRRGLRIAAVAAAMVVSTGLAFHFVARQDARANEAIAALYQDTFASHKEASAYVKGKLMAVAQKINNSTGKVNKALSKIDILKI